MYSTCLFCHRDLGRNEFVEHFQVGRRLAFDSAKGRLWVVCRGCERWNLTPLEERWEAIEECERAYSDTKLRVSTDNIGLARVREGLELVRIGEPKRPEMAAWRYGDQFGRRRRRHMLSYGVPAVAVGAFVLGELASGGLLTGAYFASNLWDFAHRAAKSRNARTRLRSGDELVPIGWPEMQEFRIIPAAGRESWSLVAPHRISLLERSTSAWHGNFDSERVLSDAARSIARLAGWSQRAVEFGGDDALHALRKVLPFVNPAGGSTKQVREAVSQLEQAPSVESYLALAARRAKHYSTTEWSSSRPDTRLRSMPSTMLLAVEMAANEQNERAAMEGELAKLADEWRDAEEIAAIADNMFVPSEISTWIDQRRRRVDLPASPLPPHPPGEE